MIDLTFFLPMSLDPTENFKKTSVASDSHLQEIMQAYWELMVVVGVAGAVLSLAWYFLKLPSQKNREEAKSGILVKLVILLVIFGGVGILGIAYGIAGALGK